MQALDGTCWATVFLPEAWSHELTREPDKTKGKTMMRAVIDSITSGVPAALTEIRKLGRTLKQRAADVLAFFDRPGTSNGPTEAINGRLEHLRGSALGFLNLTNYVARSLLEAGGFRPHLHLDCVKFFRQENTISSSSPVGYRRVGSGPVEEERVHRLTRDIVSQRRVTSLPVVEHLDILRHR